MKNKDCEGAKAPKILEEIANNIIDMIEVGYEKTARSTWKKTPIFPPCNASTGHKYTGINRLLLMYVSHLNDWGDPRFVTYNQCEHFDSERRCHVQAGERATKIIRPIPFEKLVQVAPGENLDNVPPGKILSKEGKLFKKESFVRFSAISVFNVAQTNLELDPLFELPPKCWEENEFFPKLVDCCGIPLLHGGNSAFYSPANDCIQLPQKNAFPDSASYDATLAHEFFHATGHKQRENREFGKAFGNELYAVEELRAELFSTACMHTFGISFPREKNVGYLDSWRKRIADGDVKSIVKAAADVERVFAAILDVADGQQPKLNWFPQVNFSSFPTPIKDARENAMSEQDNICTEQVRRPRMKM